MAWWLSVDHGITSAVTPFNDYLDELYDNPDENPFQRESSANKTLVFGHDALAQSLRSLDADAANIFAQ